MSTSTSACAQEPQTTADTQVQQLMAKARAAQAVFEGFSQEQVDAIVKGIGKYVYDNAEPLARMAVDETGIGVYEDKILKNKGKARAIWNNLKDKKSRGIIGEDEDDAAGLRRQADGRRRRGDADHQPDRHADVQRHVRAQDRQRRDLRAASEGREVHRAPGQRVHEDREGATAGPTTWSRRSRTARWKPPRN